MVLNGSTGKENKLINILEGIIREHNLDINNWIGDNGIDFKKFLSEVKQKGIIDDNTYKGIINII